MVLRCITVYKFNLGLSKKGLTKSKVSGIFILFFK